MAIDRDELTDRRGGLIDALTERSLVVQTFDTDASTDGGSGWEAPTELEAERIADFVIDYLCTNGTDD